MADDAEKKPAAWPATFNLSKSIRAHENDGVTVLEIDEPSADDIVAFGVLDGDLSGAQMIALIAKCAKIPPSSVKQISGRDFIKLSVAVQRFFVSAAE